MSTLPALAITPADSMHVMGEVYGASLLISLPLIAATIAYAFLRESSPGTRILLWRCTIVLVLSVCAGRLLPVHWIAWVLPEPLAWPLATLGTTQIARLPGTGSAPGSSVAAALAGVTLLYWAGVAAVLLPTLLGRLRLARARRTAVLLDSARWQASLERACAHVGVRPGSVLLVASPSVAVPVTWGLWRPVIMLPTAAAKWPVDRMEAVLIHELAHVRGGDSTTLLAARLACALCWFHPGTWWVAIRFAADAEAACDDRVLLSGVRPSKYAEWLSASIPSTRGGGLPAMALARGGIRRRLRAILDTRRRLAMPARSVVVGAAVVTAAMVTPLSTARVAPTRTVLTTLMQDARWESRAWAVIRLAQRSDSVEVARDAAHHDPDPAVRAWARYALGLSSVPPRTTPRS
jgi:beta-lactamase regulating signal transducer with metallopeptidase domain